MFSMMCCMGCLYLVLRNRIIILVLMIWSRRFLIVFVFLVFRFILFCYWGIFVIVMWCGILNGMFVRLILFIFCSGIVRVKRFVGLFWWLIVKSGFMIGYWICWDWVFLWIKWNLSCKKKLFRLSFVRWINWWFLMNWLIICSIWMWWFYCYISFRNWFYMLLM